MLEENCCFIFKDFQSEGKDIQKRAAGINHFTKAKKNPPWVESICFISNVFAASILKGALSFKAAWIFWFHCVFCTNFLLSQNVKQRKFYALEPFFFNPQIAHWWEELAVSIISNKTE